MERWLHETLEKFRSNYGALIKPARLPPGYHIVCALGYSSTLYAELAEGRFAGSAIRSALTEGKEQMTLNQMEDSRTEGMDGMADGFFCAGFSLYQCRMVRSLVAQYASSDWYGMESIRKATYST